MTDTSHGDGINFAFFNLLWSKSDGARALFSVFQTPATKRRRGRDEVYSFILGIVLLLLFRLVRTSMDHLSNAVAHCCAECGGEEGVVNLKVCKACMLVRVITHQKDENRSLKVELGSVIASRDEIESERDALVIELKLSADRIIDLEDTIVESESKIIQLETIVANLPELKNDIAVLNKSLIVREQEKLSLLSDLRDRK
jgi:hypothetical protein